MVLTYSMAKLFIKANNLDIPHHFHGVICIHQLTQSFDLL